MDPVQFISFITLPHTICTHITRIKDFNFAFFLEKTTPFEVCPKCATKSHTVYDHRIVQLAHAPCQNAAICLVVNKRRFRCPSCRAVFTEPLDGVRKGCRKTEKFKRALLIAAKNFVNLKNVARAFRCSDDYVYRSVYEQYELERRKMRYPWPRAIGIDEHAFQRLKYRQGIRWVTMVVDHKNKKLFELCLGREKLNMKESLDGIPGRENVKIVSMDMSNTYRNFVHEFFPNAEIAVDAFHVIRTFHKAIKSELSKLFGSKKRPEISKYLFRKLKTLKKPQREKLFTWMLPHPRLSKLFRCKEEIERLFAVRQLYERTREQFVRLLTEMSKTNDKVLLSLRKTLFQWRKEILCTFRTHYSNGRVEGMNNKAKLIKRAAYGYKSFDNYRLKLINAFGGKGTRRNPLRIG